MLTACYSKPQTEAIAKHIDCVMGRSDAIGGMTAIDFVEAFYQAVAYGRKVAPIDDFAGFQQLIVHQWCDLEHQTHRNPSSSFSQEAERRQSFRRVLDSVTNGRFGVGRFATSLSNLYCLCIGQSLVALALSLFTISNRDCQLEETPSNRQHLVLSSEYDKMARVLALLPD